jgi:hypothetical protein
MAHPRTKAELLAQTRAERDALLERLAGLNAEQMARPGPYGWSAKDFVAHLCEWERLLFGWYECGLRGEKPALPAEGYTWRTMDALNQAILERRRSDPVDSVMAAWRQTSDQLIELVAGLSEEDLFGKRRFAWTGGSTLAGYVYECGPNHYRWAAGEIDKALEPRERPARARKAGGSGA